MAFGGGKGYSPFGDPACLVAMAFGGGERPSLLVATFRGRLARLARTAGWGGQAAQSNVGEPGVYYCRERVTVFEMSQAAAAHTTKKNPCVPHTNFLQKAA